MSRTNTSVTGSTSCALKFDDRDWKAIRVPSAEIEAGPECSSPITPLAPVARLTSVVVCVWRSRT